MEKKAVLLFWLLTAFFVGEPIEGAVKRQAPMTQQMSLSPEVQQLCDDYWNWRLQDRPQFATFVGIHDYDDQLDDLSEQGYQNRYQQVLNFLDRATILEGSLTEEQDITNIKILIEELNTFKEGFPHQGYFFPVSYFEGPHADYKKLFGWMPKNSVEDYEKILLRMEKIPNQIDQMIELLRRGVETGKTLHAISMKTVKESLETFMVSDPTQSPIYNYSFDEMDIPSQISPNDIQELQARAQALISEGITPAFQRIRDFVVNDYFTRPEIAVTSMPDGMALYNQLVRFHTNTNFSAQQIHDIGLSQVEEIKGNMLEIIKELGYPDMNVPEFSAMLRDDPNNYYKTREKLMERFNDVSFNLIEPRLDTIFNYIPKIKLKIMENPDPNAPGAFYYAGSYDGSREGTYLVNTHELTFQPNYTIMTLSLHEGNPGHHLQSSHNIESQDVPFFRRVSDDRNYNLAPSRFPLYTAYVEGWGLYSEALGFDMNLYEDPLERYGHYSYEIFRACRLVVDTGMHALGWSKEQAVNYMLQHTADSEASSINEIDRYISWPGQALGYKIGEMKIQELRRKAEEQLGQQFDIKAFHDVVLDSYGPLNIVEDQVNKWISRTLNPHQNMPQEDPETPNEVPNEFPNEILNEIPNEVPPSTQSSVHENSSTRISAISATLLIAVAFISSLF